MARETCSHSFCESINSLSSSTSYILTIPDDLVFTLHMGRRRWLLRSSQFPSHHLAWPTFGIHILVVPWDRNQSQQPILKTPVYRQTRTMDIALLGSHQSARNTELSHRFLRICSKWQNQRPYLRYQVPQTRRKSNAD